MTAIGCTRFSGKRAIVTGGASGIGEATVRRLLAEGATVLAADIREDALADLAASVSGDRLLIIRIDMMDLAQVEALIAHGTEQLGGLDVLINNAGIGSFGTVADITLDHWREVLSIDLDAVMWASRHALPHLTATRGCIVNVASVAGARADYGFAAYNVAKAAVINLTRAMALDNAPAIRVNSVSPGLTRTPLATGLTDNPDIMTAWRDALPLGRAGEPAEVAAAIAFLASNDASYVNGHDLVVDGGGSAHTGLPNFTRILGGQSHLDSADSFIRRKKMES